MKTKYYTFVGLLCSAIITLTALSSYGAIFCNRAKEGEVLRFDNAAPWSSGVFLTVSLTSEIMSKRELRFYHTDKKGMVIFESNWKAVNGIKESNPGIIDMDVTPEYLFTLELSKGKKTLTLNKYGINWSPDGVYISLTKVASHTYADNVMEDNVWIAVGGDLVMVMTDKDLWTYSMDLVKLNHKKIDNPIQVGPSGNLNYFNTMGGNDIFVQTGPTASNRIMAGIIIPEWEINNAGIKALKDISVLPVKDTSFDHTKNTVAMPWYGTLDGGISFRAKNDLACLYILCIGPEKATIACFSFDFESKELTRMWSDNSVNSWKYSDSSSLNDRVHTVMYQSSVYKGKTSQPDTVSTYMNLLYSKDIKSHIVSGGGTYTTYSCSSEKLTKVPGTDTPVIVDDIIIASNIDGIIYGTPPYINNAEFVASSASITKISESAKSRQIDFISTDSFTSGKDYKSIGSGGTKAFANARTKLTDTEKAISQVFDLSSKKPGKYGSRSGYVFYHAPRLKTSLYKRTTHDDKKIVSTGQVGGQVWFTNVEGVENSFIEFDMTNPSKSTYVPNPKILAGLPPMPASDDLPGWWNETKKKTIFNWYASLSDKLGKSIAGFQSNAGKFNLSVTRTQTDGAGTLTDRELDVSFKAPKMSTNVKSNTSLSVSAKYVADQNITVTYQQRSPKGITGAACLLWAKGDAGSFDLPWCNDFINATKSMPWVLIYAVTAMPGKQTLALPIQVNEQKTQNEQETFFYDFKPDEQIKGLF